MALKFVVDDISDVPEGSRGEYESRDGKHYLKIDGDIPAVMESNAKLAEFRDNNIALNKKQTELEKSLERFKDVDPTEYNKLKTEVDDLKRAGGKHATDIESRINAAVSPLEEKLAGMQRDKEEAEDNLARQTVEADLTKVGLKVGIDERAMSDFLARGANTFNLEGKAMKGDVALYSRKSPTEGLSMEEWAAGLMQDAPHLFKQSKGGGTRPDKRTNTGARIISTDPLEFGRNLEGIAKGEVVVNSEL